MSRAARRLRGPDALRGILDPMGRLFIARDRVALDEPWLEAPSGFIWRYELDPEHDAGRDLLGPVEPRAHTSLLARGHQPRLVCLDLSPRGRLEDDSPIDPSAYGLFLPDDVDGREGDGGAEFPYSTYRIDAGVLSFRFPEGGWEERAVLAPALAIDNAARVLTASRIRAAIGVRFENLVTLDAPDVRVSDLRVEGAGDSFQIRCSAIGAIAGRPGDVRELSIELPWSTSDSDPREHLVAAIRARRLSDGAEWDY